MAANENQTHETDKSQPKQIEEQQDARELKETDLDFEGLEERIAPATVISLE